MAFTDRQQIEATQQIVGKLLVNARQRRPLTLPAIRHLSGARVVLDHHNNKASLPWQRLRAEWKEVVQLAAASYGVASGPLLTDSTKALGAWRRFESLVDDRPPTSPIHLPDGSVSFVDLSDPDPANWYTVPSSSAPKRLGKKPGPKKRPGPKPTMGAVYAKIVRMESEGHSQEDIEAMVPEAIGRPASWWRMARSRRKRDKTGAD